MALDLPALGKIGGGPTVTCSMEKPDSTLKLLLLLSHVSRVRLCVTS